MTKSLVQIEHEAIELPLADRAHLIASLIASLDSADEGDVEAAWEREVLARSDELCRGAVRAVPSAEALTRARRNLR